MTLFGPTEAARSAELAKRRTVARYLVAFLDKHLQGQAVELIDEPHDRDHAELRIIRSDPAKLRPKRW